MKKSKFSEAQIATASLRQVEAEAPIPEMTRALDISEATYSVWRKQYGQMGIAEFRRLRQLEEENCKLQQLVADVTLDKVIRLDNGPELLADRFVDWCTARAIELRYIQPGKPEQNAFIERFNRTDPMEVLDAYVFESLEQVREISAEWLQTYNDERPHDALAGLPPVVYRAQLEVRSSPLAASPYPGSLQGRFSYASPYNCKVKGTSLSLEFPCRPIRDNQADPFLVEIALKTDAVMHAIMEKSTSFVSSTWKMRLSCT